MQDWIYPYDTKIITVLDSIDLAYVEEGEGEHVLLFIHGLGSNLKAWQKNIDDLKSDYRCIALDLPGYGKSEKGAYTYEMQFFSEVIAAFIQEKKLEGLTLVGHSMGGQISLNLCLDHPELAAQLILIAPAGFEKFSEAEKQWFERAYNAELIKNLTTEQIEANFKLNFKSFPEDAEYMIADRLLLRETVEYDDFCNMIPQCVFGMLNAPVYDRLPEIQQDCLVVFGKEDALIPNPIWHAQQSTEIIARSGVERIPNSQLELLSPCGHFVQWECASQLNSLIRGFLQ